jgi:hypothetical protein
MCQGYACWLCLSAPFCFRREGASQRAKGAHPGCYVVGYRRGRPCYLSLEVASDSARVRCSGKGGHVRSNDDLLYLRTSNFINRRGFSGESLACGGCTVLRRQSRGHGHQGVKTKCRKSSLCLGRSETADADDSVQMGLQLLGWEDRGVFLWDTARGHPLKVWSRKAPPRELGGGTSPDTLLGNWVAALER